VQDDSSARFQKIEQGVAALFSDLADLFGNPRSFGAIFGLLFASSTPLSMEEVAERLGISVGSTSQGLRQLEEFGAVTHERDPETRANLYSARTELKPLIIGFLNQRVFPRMEAAVNQIAELKQGSSELPPDQFKHFKSRLDRLATWHSRARTLYPIARKLLGGD
jgi:DNA-binding transcriptional regulator GbsR (MarR family)